MAATAVVLDLDGTIWDSYPLYAQALERERGIPTAQTELALRQGENIVRLIEGQGLSRQRFAAACTDLVTDEVLYPGVVPSLDRLEAREIPVGVVTSLPNAIAGPLLDALSLSDRFVDMVFAARKPNPAGILNVLRAANVKPSLRVFYVGDHDRDSEAARNAGVSFAWASYGYGGEEPGYVSVRVANAHALSTL